MQGWSLTLGAAVALTMLATSSAMLAMTSGSAR